MMISQAVSFGSSRYLLMRERSRIPQSPQKDHSTMKTLLALIALCLPAFAQVPQIANTVSVCTEGCTITAISSPTAVLQFGAGTTWGPAFTMKAFPQFINYSSPANTTLSPFDPAPGVTKALVAQQQATAYTVTYSLNGVKTVKTIPALPSTTYKFACTASIPTGPMPATLPLSCAPGVKQ